MRKRKLSSVRFLMLLLFVLVAGFAQGQKKETFKVWLFDIANFQAGYNVLIPEFEKRYPELKVERLNLGWDEMHNKFTTALSAGGELPDMTEIPVSSISPFIRAGAFAAVPEWVMKRSEIKDKYWPQPMAFLDYKGQLYGLACTYTTDKAGVIYNKKLWKNAGVAPSQAGTWEDFMRVAQKLTKRDTSGNITVTGVTNHGGEEEETLLGWAMQYGGKVVSEDGSRVLLNHEAGRKALRTYMDVFEKWKVDDPKFSAWDVFPKEQTASFVVGPWYGFSTKQDYPHIEWGFFPQPKLTSTPPYFTLTVGWVRVVPKGAANPEAGFKWLKFMAEEQNAVTWALYNGELPPLKKASRDPKILADPALGPVAPLLQYGLAIDLRDANKYREVFYNVLDEITLKKIPFDEGLKKLETEGNKVMAEFDDLY